MQTSSAQFWVQAQPELVSAALGVSPTSVARGQPYDYWSYTVEDTDVESVFLGIFSFLRSVRGALPALPQGSTYGLTFSMTVTDDGRNSFHHLEPQEMMELAEMRIPVAFQIICERPNPSVKGTSRRRAAPYVER
jgi:hypothetical protein